MARSSPPHDFVVNVVQRHPLVGIHGLVEPTNNAVHFGRVGARVLNDDISSVLPSLFRRHCTPAWLSGGKQRRERLCAALSGMRAGHKLYPAGISAGLHLTLRLDPEGPTEPEILARARERSVVLEALGPNWINPADRPAGVVIGYAAPAEHAFRPAAQALIDALDPS